MEGRKEKRNFAAASSAALKSRTAAACRAGFAAEFVSHWSVIRLKQKWATFTRGVIEVIAKEETKLSREEFDKQIGTRSSPIQIRRIAGADGALCKKKRRGPRGQL